MPYKNGRPRKTLTCRECQTEYVGGKGRRYCDDCRGASTGVTNAKVKKYVYKISYAELARLDAITECEVCGESGDMVIDHNHETGKVRGRLCRNCNFALGHVKDQAEVLRGLALYLEDRDGS